MGGGAAQTQIKRDVNIEPENIKERRRDDNAALETQRAAALAAASGVAEPPPGTPGTQSPGLAGLEQTMTRQFDAQFGAPSGISVMKTALESVKKSGDSGSEYNAVLARMDRVNILWGGVSNQESFAAVRGDLLDAYDGLIAACNTYLRTHKGFRWTSVGRHRVRRITEIAQFAAERKGAVEAAPIIAPQAPAEEIIEPPQEIPAEPPNPVEFVAAIPAGLAETAAPAEASTEAPAEASTEASAKTPAGAPVVPEDPRRTFYLNNGTWTGNKRKGWLLDLAGDAVRTEMADKFKTHSDAQFANDLAIFNARLTDLQTECGNFLREKRRDNSILRSSAFFDKAQEEMFAIIAGGADAIKADYKADEDIGAAFASVMGNHAAETGTYDRRRHELLAGDMALAEGAVDKNQTILGYLHDTEMEDEAFGEKAKRYRENASAHLDTARRAFVDRFLSPKARESALGRFIESMGGNILKGTVAGAEMTAADMARLAHVKAPDAVELERSFRSDMLDAKFKEEWLPLLYADYGDLDKAARGKADLKAMMLDIIENSQDRITNLPTAADIAAVNSAPKTQRDAFSDFCSWEGFAGILKGHESGIRDAVNKALSAGGIKLKIKSEKKDGEAAKEVTYAKNIDDLSNLAPSRLDKAYAPLRANILTNITEWETISDKALKKQMTEHLVLCPTQEEFMKKLAAARAGAEAREREDKIRFEASLMAPASEKRELQRHAMYYNYTDVAANTALTKEDRDSARLGRLRASAGLREQLKPGDYTEIRDIFLEVYKEAHEAPAGKPAESYEDKMDKNLHDNLKKRLKPIAVRLKKLKPEPKELIAALESTSGAMELLLTEFAPEAVEGGGQFSKSFTSEEHKSYVRKLATATHRAMSRQKELDAALDTAQNLPDERKQLFRANMRDMIVNLAPVEPELVTPGNDSENNKTANQARFGAASWGDALMKLRAMISAETNADAATAENKDLHENSKLAAELMAARLESLKQKTTAEGESIFEYALPLLRKRPATARILMFGTEGEFDALEARLTVPLTLIAGQYSTISLIARQMVLRHFDEMAGEPKSESDWSGIFKKTSDDINKHESVTSIDNMFNRLLDKKNTRNMMRHFPVILEASGGDFEKLASKKGLDEYQKRYSENTKVFSTFWAAQATAAPGGDKSAAAADRKGFEKFVERYMFMLDSAPDPKAKTKGKAAQAAPQADSAYDHGGLLKAYRQGNQGEPAFFDTAFLDYMFTAYKEERTSSLQALALAKQVMNRRRAKRDEIDERRAEGAKATARDDALTRRLREERYAGLSPLMAGMLEHESAAAGTAEEKEKQRTERMNALRDATKTKAVKDTSKGLNTKVIEPAEKDGAISGAVRGSALERRIMGADSNDELSRASVTKLKLLEGRLQAIDFAGHARRLSRAEIEDFMPYVQIFGRAWQAVDIGSGPGPAYDGELQALYASYAKRRKAVADIEAIELTGVALASARDEAARDLSYAIYVLEEDVFAPLAANKERYFKNAQLCEAMFAEEADKHGAPAERVSQNLREYFASDLQKDGLDPETLREGVSALLSDSDTRDYISGVAAKDPISPEKFKALSTDVSYDALEDYELTSRGTDDRRTFEHMLRTDTRWFTDTRLRKSFWKRYSALDLDEKRLFALALTLPDIRPSSAAMPNAGIGAGAEKKAAMRGRNADVAAYIGGEDFKPKVDYSLAIHTLTNRDGTVKGGLFEQDVFNNAYNFVEICRLQRADSQGELSHLLSDPDATLSYNKHFSDEDRKKVISSFSSLTDALRASHGADDKDAKTRIDSLADMGKTPRGMLLIAVLQDRTMLDYTTKMSAWNRKGGDYHPFANESGRDDLLDKYVKTGSVDSLASGEFTNAYLVLNSYQVRDDAKLNKMHSVRKDDLKGGALGRKSAIDWELLDRAFDFVKAAEEERRRIMALGNLVPAENKDANSEFSEVAAMPEDKADESELDRRIKFHAKKDKMLPELAGYLSLGA
ncbi:MAG: hypothetical protein LBJ84_04665, partial [Oscillospiraceae bacterium]|nr:hypothetical protein [Oscillospiraceae bacterium]